MAAVLPSALAQQDNDIRGLFVLGSGEGLRNRTEFERLKSSATSAGINRLYFEVRGVEGVSYQSRLEKLSPSITAGDADPFGNLVLLGFHGLDVSVWPTVTMFPSFKALYSTRPTSGNVLQQFPGLIALNAAGDVKTTDSLMLIDPGSSSGYDYLLAVLIEIVKRYQPQGIALKDYEFPDETWGYNAASVDEFRLLVGGNGPPPPDDETWTAWRRARLTGCLTRLRAVLHESKPDLQISVVVSAQGPAPRNWNEWLESAPYDKKMQDWVRWMQEDAVDEIVLQNDARPGATAENLLGWIEFARRHSYGKRVVCMIPGESNSTPDVLDMTRRARARGAGIALWNYGRPTRDDASAFFRTTLRSTFLLPSGGGTPQPPYPHDLAPPRFLLMAEPPPAIQLGNAAATPTPTPLPEARMTRLEKTPAVATAGPAPAATAAPARPGSFKIITLSNGQTMRAIVLEQNKKRGTITIQPSGGSRLELPMTTIQSIKDE
ncbi:family 10 glycosylhydrolase [Candidatus Poribacteria bacterium]|nr:family 10 glycosylhydrolase [Candidatus Poribacteria bacterium]